MGREFQIRNIGVVSRVVREEHEIVAYRRGGNPGITAVDWPSKSSTMDGDVGPVAGHFIVVWKDDAACHCCIESLSTRLRPTPDQCPIAQLGDGLETHAGLRASQLRRVKVGPGVAL